MLVKSNANEEVVINLILKELKKFLVLTPHSAARKVALIEHGEHLNDNAQSALLKIFEEAPKHAVIIICVKTPDSLLETTVSRAVKLSFWKQELKPDEIYDKKLEETFENFLSKNLSGRYLLTEKLVGNYKPKDFFENWLKFLRARFLKDPEKMLGIIKASRDIYFKLNETYVNSKLAFDELILSLENNS